MPDNQTLDREIKKRIKLNLKSYIKPAYYFEHSRPLIKYQEIQIDIDLLTKFISKQISQVVQKAVKDTKNKAVLDYILSLGWQDTENEYVKEVIADADRIAKELYKQS